MKVVAIWEEIPEQNSSAFGVCWVHGKWEKGVMTVDIPVPLDGIPAVCHVLCPAAFQQDV